MLYCPGKGQELLAALGVNLECHTSSIFSCSEPPFWAFCRGFHISEAKHFPRQKAQELPI